MATRTGILGGTFDPIHLGHLDAAAAARDAFGLDEVLLMPAGVPPHRDARPVAGIFHRFAMVAIAAMTREGLIASDRELRRTGPSYTSLTLQALWHGGQHPSQIFFICGADAFADIATWHDYPAILDRAHFVVVSRPGRPAPDLPARLPALASRMAAVDRPAGPLPARPAILLLESATADVSSTDIRRRTASGAPVTGLVPPGVAAYIDRHGLYRAAGPLHDA